MIFRAEPNIN